MDIKQIRYENARRLVDKAGGISAFGERIGKSQAQTSSFAGKSPSKGIGDKIARQIEEAFEMPRGWLDRHQDEVSEKLTLINHAIKDFSNDELMELLAQADLIKRRKRGEL